MQVGEWKYGYSSFYFDITEALRNGENEILVRSVFRNPNSRWYSGAGIYRNVWLEMIPQAHILREGIYVSARKTESRETDAGTWSIQIDTELMPAGKDMRKAGLRVEILDKQGDCVAEKLVSCADSVPMPDRILKTLPVDETGAVSCKTELFLQNPKLWDIETPVCYTCAVSFYYEGQLIDRDSTVFGCRTCSFTTDKGFFLNGKRRKLNGVCNHHDLGALGAAFHPAAARRQLEILKRMGCNALRTSHNMPAPGLLELADEMGILVLDEAFDMWERSKTPYDYARFFREWADKDVASWVRRDRNHPSVIMWSIGNEIYDTHADEDGVRITGELMQRVVLHDYRQNAKPTIGSNYMPWENAQKCAEVIKLAGYNYAERLYQEHHEKHPDWIIYGSETSSTVQSRGIYHFPLKQSLLVDDDEQCSSLGNSTTSWGAKSVDYCLRMERDHEFSLGQFLWSGFDYIGEPTPYHTKNSYFGQIDTAGFLKDSYYMYQAGWTDCRENPMVHVLPYWDFNEGQNIDVRIVSNAPQVELIVNGTSEGRKNIDHKHGESFCADWQIPYHAGSLLAIAYNEEGQEIAREEEHSFGDAETVCIEIERDTIYADKNDMAFVTITVKDKDGCPVKNANNRVQVKVEGAGRLIGLDNGDSTDYDSYKGTSRRLFSGKLLAMVAPKGKAGVIEITVTSEGLKSAKCSLTVEGNVHDACGVTEEKPVYYEENADTVKGELVKEIPVRKLEICSPDGQKMDAERRELIFEAAIRPYNATYRDIEWRISNDAGITVPNAELEYLNKEGTKVKVKALGDGDIRIRAACRNGAENIRLISQLELSIAGVGEMYTNPYEFVSGGLYSAFAGDIGNGNERGVSMSRTGMSWVAYENLDFGKDGATEVTLPIFELGSEPTCIKFWKGIPYAEGSERIGEGIYDKKSIWNVYQEETFVLEKRLTGLTTFGIELDKKVHIKGFTFKKASRAFEILQALECDAVYGDSFEQQADAITGIGNNVSLVFKGELMQR